MSEHIKHLVTSLPAANWDELIKTLGHPGIKTLTERFVKRLPVHISSLVSVIGIALWTCKSITVVYICPVGIPLIF